MRVSDFHYELPQYLIAQRPTLIRSESRLLVLDGASGRLEDRRFADLPALFNPGDLLVFNDTRVMRARLIGRRPTGGRVEILIERVVGEHRALAHMQPARTQKPGGTVLLTDDITARILERRPDDLFLLEFEATCDLHQIMDRVGRVPLPPYIAREDDATDVDRYQTIYGRRPGAIAAPTAGLHFDDALLAAFDARGVRRAYVTLHVGAGTFQPVRAEHVEEHRMHCEYIEVNEAACRAIEAACAQGGRIVAVGTTSVRALESAAAGGRLMPMACDTDLFITPGYRFRVVDVLITNFHLPESTLLMLVCAFAGRERVLNAYQHAVRQRYRFYSYGDAMFVTPATHA
ncbi:MAG TPA: tRNA preQ1(34) S-adenosylmethionine ribosyltransferase-isomerase QueA [Gammaproteobacteria bacterium]|nr:tRNA preQ1(34) S-adenosylmethionine ribosyltransferase-isomerase QueA [Gammaproteobacteria bacterium]